MTDILRLENYDLTKHYINLKIGVRIYFYFLTLNYYHKRCPLRKSGEFLASGPRVRGFDISDEKRKTEKKKFSRTE